MKITDLTPENVQIFKHGDHYRISLCEHPESSQNLITFLLQIISHSPFMVNMAHLRTMQKAFFETRAKSALNHSKRLEMQIDGHIEKMKLFNSQLGSMATYQESRKDNKSETEKQQAANL